jgi:hypothetical protein
MTTASDVSAAESSVGTVGSSAPGKFGWLKETAIVVGFYYVYQGIRSLADHRGVTNRAYANARRLVGWERTIGIFHEQSIQQAVLAARWFIKAMNIYYGTLHFVITVGLLVWLYMKRHHAYRAMRNLLGLTTGLALIGYWAFPLAPPRLYKCNHSIPASGPAGRYAIGKCFDDTLAKVGGLWSYHSPVAKAVANQYAAMPSLHFAWALWCAIVIHRHSRHAWVRALGLLYPLLTLMSIVITANHYFLDAVGGAVLILTASSVIRFHERRRSQKLLRAASGDLAPAQ